MVATRTWRAPQLRLASKTSSEYCSNYPSGLRCGNNLMVHHRERNTVQSRLWRMGVCDMEKTCARAISDCQSAPYLDTIGRIYQFEAQPRLAASLFEGALVVDLKVQILKFQTQGISSGIPAPRRRTLVTIHYDRQVVRFLCVLQPVPASTHRVYHKYHFRQ